MNKQKQKREKEDFVLLPENLVELIEQNRDVVIDNVEKWIRDWNRANSIEAEILRDLSELRKDLDPNTKPLKLTTTRKVAIRKLTVEGYSVEDFKAVHRFKILEWWQTEFRKYCTPETLYRESNFPRYVEQASVEPFDELEERVSRIHRTNGLALKLATL